MSSNGSLIPTVLIVAALCGVCLGAPRTWYVDTACVAGADGTAGNPFCHIKDAAVAAADGEEITVAPGTYMEVVNLLGKSITLRSQGGRDVTTVDATGRHLSALRCDSQEGPTSVIEGFAFVGGEGTYDPVRGLRLGGGLYALDSSPSILSCSFGGNEADLGAGAALVNSSAALTDCIIAASFATGNGGGVYVESGSPSFVNCTLWRNSTNDVMTRGGGLYATDSVLDMTNCVFELNVSNAGDGGGAYLYRSTLTMTGGGFAQNRAREFDFFDVVVGGGGLMLEEGTGTLTDVTFVGNTAESASDGGGAVHVINSDHAFVRCDFSDNAAFGGTFFQERGGGAVFAAGFRGSFDRCGFSGSFTEESDGGAVHLDTCSPTFTGCRFTDNEAGAPGTLGYGGAIYATGVGDVSVVGSWFTGNRAVRWGGAIYSVDGANLSLVNSVLQANSATMGAGVYQFGTRASVVHCTMTDHVGTVIRSSQAGGGAVVRNSILWNPLGTDVSDAGAAVSKVSSCDLATPWSGAGGGNITVDPQFMVTALGDFYPAPGSPCIDAGDNALVPAGVETDLDGRPRVLHNLVDQGAVEWWPGDFGRDDDVDMEDWDTFAVSLRGPHLPLPLGSNPGVDFDGDGDCDLRDAAVFMTHFGDVLP